jgi:methionyl-tRNA synthetase
MLITTPIFYVNAKPHLGHAYTMVLADVYYRYRKFLLGETSNHLRTGCDEHGLKVQNAAMIKGIPELRYCQEMSVEFENLARDLDVDYSSFVRTTHKEHKERVAIAWSRMVEIYTRGNIRDGTQLPMNVSIGMIKSKKLMRIYIFQKILEVKSI